MELSDHTVKLKRNTLAMSVVVFLAIAFGLNVSGFDFYKVRFERLNSQWFVVILVAVNLYNGWMLSLSLKSDATEYLKSTTKELNEQEISISVNQPNKALVQSARLEIEIITDKLRILVPEPADLAHGLGWRDFCCGSWKIAFWPVGESHPHDRIHFQRVWIADVLFPFGSLALSICFAIGFLVVSWISSSHLLHGGIVLIDQIFYLSR